MAPPSHSQTSLASSSAAPSSTTGLGAPAVPRDAHLPGNGTDSSGSASDPSDAEKLAPSGPAQPGGPPGGGGGGPPSDEDLFQPRSIRFWLTLLCNFLALFLVALDRTIIATAVPRISDEFQSLGDIGWYGSSYMLTTACAQLLFGRVYKFYDMKWVFLLSIIIFEIGSALCGAAPNSTAFIVGRAIAGLGSAGIFSGCLLIMIPMIPLHRRPAFQGLFGMVFGIASVMGPLIGGGFTGGVTWRWCFYINLPIGAVALVFMVFFWNPPKERHEPAPWKVHVKRLDPLGMFFFLPGVVCLFIAFQWGGSVYRWNDWPIIVLFAVFAVCTAAFVAVQILMPGTASVPPKVITQRSVAFGTGFTFFLAGSMLMLVYYVPVWFQTVKQVDPIKSGIYTLPLVLSLVVSSIMSGAITQKIGYYVPSMLVAPAIMSIGEGLLSTLDRASPTSHWVAYQFLSGFGLGFGMQTSGLAIQTVLPKPDISTGIAINFFVQQLGGAVFTSVGQTILTNKLVSELAFLPGLTPELIVKEGATKLTALVPPEDVSLVLDAYNAACRHIFLASMGLAFASLLCAFGMEWRSIKKGRNGPPGPPGTSPPGGNNTTPKKGGGKMSCPLTRAASSASPAATDASSANSTSDADNKKPPAAAGPVPGRPFFEDIKTPPRQSKSTRRRPRSGVLTKPAPAALTEGGGGKRHSAGSAGLKREGSGVGGGLRREGGGGGGGSRRARPLSDGEGLEGALRDWARYSLVAGEEAGEVGGGVWRDEKRGDGGDGETGGKKRDGKK